MPKITRYDVLPDLKEVSEKLKRFSELMEELDQIQSYLNQKGFGMNIKLLNQTGIALER